MSLFGQAIGNSCGFTSTVFWFIIHLCGFLGYYNNLVTETARIEKV